MSLRVYARMKDEDLDVFSRNNDACVVKIPTKINSEGNSCMFTNIWQTDKTNNDIYSEIIEKTVNVTENYWVAFGYTGSGKTYTIMGLLERLLELHSLDSARITITGYQIYNEKIYDIFNNNQILKCWKTNDLKIKNLTSKEVESVSNIMKTIKENRKLARTEMNCLSSRSHAIFTITTPYKRHIFVDMAGQESGKTAMYGENDQIKKEGTDINLNMLALKDCIVRMNKKHRHIPFRRCLLTMALKSMFYKRCNISFICTLSKSQGPFYMYDTIKYASALYRPERRNSNEKIYTDAMNEYTKYLTDIKYDEAQEMLLWREIKYGNQEKLPKIVKIIDTKIKKMISFREKAVKYVDKLPKIET